MFIPNEKSVLCNPTKSDTLRRAGFYQKRGPHDIVIPYYFFGVRLVNRDTDGIDLNRI
jgi:hypothetical protein